MITQICLLKLPKSGYSYARVPSNVVQRPGMYKLNEPKADQTICLQKSLSHLQNSLNRKKSKSRYSLRALQIYFQLKAKSQNNPTPFKQTHFPAFGEA